MNRVAAGWRPCPRSMSAGVTSRCPHSPGMSDSPGSSGGLSPGGLDPQGLDPLGACPVGHKHLLQQLPCWLDLGLEACPAALSPLPVSVAPSALSESAWAAWACLWSQGGGHQGAGGLTGKVAGWAKGLALLPGWPWHHATWVGSSTAAHPGSPASAAAGGGAHAQSGALSLATPPPVGAVIGRWAPRRTFPFCLPAWVPALPQCLPVSAT